MVIYSNHYLKKGLNLNDLALGLNATTLSANMKHLSIDHASTVSATAATAATALGFGPHASQALAE